MKKSIKHKMSMYQIVLDTINEYHAVWENTPKFVSAYDKFTAKFESLKVHAEKQRSYTVGVRDNRDELRRSTAQYALMFASALTALGEETKNVELIALMRVTESQLIRRSHSDTVILIDRILIHVHQYAADLLEYGITADMITDLQTRRDDIVVNILAPRKAIIKRKDSSMQLEKITGEIDQLLKNSLDSLVRVLRPIDEDFYNAYFNARPVIVLGGSGSGISGAATVVPDEPDEGL